MSKRMMEKSGRVRTGSLAVSFIEHLLYPGIVWGQGDVKMKRGHSLGEAATAKCQPGRAGTGSPEGVPTQAAPKGRGRPERG